MAHAGWRLKQISDFFYLLVNAADESGKNVLQRRFKKDLGALNSLYDLIEKIDELGYEAGVEFAFGSKRFDTIKGTRFCLIEIRRIKKTWRVITYWNKKQEAFVMLDAFEAHKHKSMQAMLEQVSLWRSIQNV